MKISIYKLSFLVIILSAYFYMPINKSYALDNNIASELNGGEDVSYDSELEDLIPLEYYDTSLNTDIDTSINSSITPKLPKALLKNNKKPQIAIIIDDMGVNRKMSKKAVEDLNPLVSLSFLPYSNNIQQQVDRAKEKGHEIMLHLPWEPNRKTADPGPNNLNTESSIDELYDNLKINLDSFKGYDGVNNHMGSKFSHYRDGVEIVMDELKNRGVFFLDSRTTAKSIAEKIAKEYSVPTSRRDVFLDHIETKEFIIKSLKKLEKIALVKGSAIAIGHPKAITIAALEKWIPTLEAKGFKLVKVNNLIKGQEVIYNSNISYMQKIKIIK